MSICPKNKSSKSRRDKRRANWKMGPVNLVKCSKCGALMMPHRVCKAFWGFSSGAFVYIIRLSEDFLWWGFYYSENQEILFL